MWWAALTRLRTSTSRNIDLAAVATGLPVTDDISCAGRRRS